jgi:hypothetical protein
MKRTPLRKVSKKRQKELREYSKLRKAHLSEHPTCEVCKERQATDIHHILARGRGGGLNDTGNFLAVCRPCHTLIHEKPSYARENGWLI